MAFLSQWIFRTFPANGPAWATRLLVMGLLVTHTNNCGAGLIETFEAPGVTQSTVSNTQVVNFNNLATGSYTSQVFQFSNLTATYSGNFSIIGATQYGGAPDPLNPSKEPRKNKLPDS